MMKPIGKKILTGTITAAFLIGGAGVLHNTQAHAATGTAAAQNTNTSETNDHGKRGHGHDELQQAATILGVDQTTIQDQLKQGKTLAQVAQDKGVTEDVLLQKLTDAENQSIDAAVAAGKLTQNQADKKKSGLADHLKKEVENTEQNDGHEKGRGGFADPAALAQILGITQQVLNANLQAGQSLAEIAQANSISKDQLISKIKDGMTDKIKQFVDKKDQPEAGDTPDVPDASDAPATSSNSAAN